MDVESCDHNWMLLEIAGNSIQQYPSNILVGCSWVLLNVVWCCWALLGVLSCWLLLGIAVGCL